MPCDAGGDRLFHDFPGKDGAEDHQDRARFDSQEVGGSEVTGYSDLATDSKKASGSRRAVSTSMCARSAIRRLILIASSLRNWYSSSARRSKKRTAASRSSRVSPNPVG